MSWALHPTWFEPNGPLAQTSPPATLSAEDANAWRKSLELTDVGGSQVLSIAKAFKSVAVQSAFAARRYKLLESLEERFPEWLTLAVHLAEAHYLLNDTHGACVRLCHVQATLGSGQDAVLDEAVRQLQRELSCTESEESMWTVPGGVVAKRYRRPEFSDGKYRPDTEGTRARWLELQTQHTESLALDQFARYVAVQTNILEGVFEMEGRTWSGLVKQGFAANSVEGISRTSRIQKPQKILDILINTVNCFALLSSAIKDTTAYDEEFIKQVHRTLLKGDNLTTETVDDEEISILVPRGEYRHTPCYIAHHSRGYETWMCPWPEVSAEMSWYCTTAQTILERRELNPFVAAAWLQFAFLRIHPFADGNGRVSRMISSIPLIRAGLPPVVVPAERKDRYFTALDAADGDGSVDALAALLKQEAERAIKAVANLGEGSLHVQVSSPLSVNTEASTPSPLRQAMDAAAARGQEV